MIVNPARNVHQALPEACHQLLENGYERASRNGKVRLFPLPFTTLYARPTERVVFHPERDANPFFHLFESLWMLAGRNDVDYPAQFAEQLRDYSDDGKTFNAAYGYRWRRLKGDQLRSIVEALATNPDCRRQVLQIWDTTLDLGTKTKDAACNTQAYFQRGDAGELNMLVSNRSNDMIWGAYGANAVHFSVLQEFLASWIGCPVGAYWQVSMNTHVYERHFPLMQKLADEAPDAVAGVRPSCPYSRGEVEAFPLVTIPVGRWQRELDTFLKLGAGTSYYDDPFFQEVASPMLRAWESHKRRQYGEAITHAAQVAATDWRRAASEWLQRREIKWKSKSA